jgi:hypothetical protein
MWRRSRRRGGVKNPARTARATSLAFATFKVTICANGIPADVVNVIKSGDGSQDIEWAQVRLEIDVLQRHARSRVFEERQSLRRVSMGRVKFTKGRPESLHGRVCENRTDIEIARQHGRAMQHGREPAHDDELDLRVAQRLQ